ncbi:MAG: hypothetical protein AAFM92_09150 [Pseudomonadota bacterium]
MRASSLALVALLLPAPLAAEEYTAPRDLGCVPHAELDTEITPPELARVVRACIHAGVYENAFAVWLSFNSYALYDQQRVKDESAHMVLQDLYSWTFAGYSRDIMDEVKAAADLFRDPESRYFLEACAAMVETGQPTYRPTYMIATGMWPLKNPEDWRTVPFDGDAAWRKALSEINSCPAF